MQRAVFAAPQVVKRQSPRSAEIQDAFGAVFAESLFTAIPNLTGIPAIACGGVQFMADALRDTDLLNLAEALEGGNA